MHISRINLYIDHVDILDPMVFEGPGEYFEALFLASHINLIII